MATYKIKDEHGNTINTIIADEVFVEDNYPGQWELVPDVSTPAINWKITKLAYLTRFTNEEAVAIDLASIGATVEAAMVRRYQQLVSVSEFISLKDERLRDALSQLVAANLLTAARATEILDTVPTAEELA